MHRRACLAVLLAPLMSPAAALAAASRRPRIGMLWYGAPLERRQPALDAFRRGLAEHGFVEGQSVTLEHRHSGATLDSLPALAAELVRARVDVIVATGPVAIRAARQATSTIPIVMLNGDPEMFSNLSRPDRNVTGLTALAAELAGKQMQLLKEAVPGLSRVAMLKNPAQPVHVAKVREVERVAGELKVDVHVIEVRGPADFEGAFAEITRARAGALVVPADGTYAAHAGALVELAARHRLPAVYGGLSYAAAGGLIQYVPSEDEAFRTVARYVTRILKGAAPSELPIEQPTRFHLTVNARTGKALGLSLPPTLLLRADEVIE